MNRNCTAPTALLIASLGLTLGAGAMLAPGQGPTGRETPNANANKKGTSVNRKRNTGATRANPSKNQTSTSDEGSYVPVGPTAKTLIFLRDFVASHGRIEPSKDAPFEIYVEQQFVPLEPCKAKITWSFGDNFEFDTVSFSDLDSSLTKGTINRIPTTKGDHFSSSIEARTSNGQKLIEHKIKLLPSGRYRSEERDYFGFEVADDETGSNQAQVIRALKNLIEACSGTPTSPASSLEPHNPNIELVKIPPGSFMMGRASGRQDEKLVRVSGLSTFASSAQSRGNPDYSDEKPVHRVTINYSFYMGKYEVTNAQWQAVMGTSRTDCGDCPVENISWDAAQSFIQRLNQMDVGYIYRLPTEAEWEYACRAGTQGDYAGILGEMAWYELNSEGHRHPVGLKRPNAWGLHDMHGNVFEWCEDWYHQNYDGAPTDGSAWLSRGVAFGLARWTQQTEKLQGRVLRGGAWLDAASWQTSAVRYAHPPDDYPCCTGFRVVAVPRTQ